MKGDESVLVSHQISKETVTGQIVGAQIELKLCVYVCVWEYRYMVSVCTVCLFT